MKRIHILFLTGLLPFLSGCDKNEGVYAYSKEIEIQYVDKQGNILYFDKDGNISCFDKVDYFSRKLNEEDFLTTCPMEIISFTNEKGIPLEYKFSYKAGHLFGLGIQENNGQKSEYSYVVKYKIPPFTGDSVEELRVTLKENRGFPCGWHNCRYNGKDIRVYTMEEIFPDYHNPQQVVDEEKYARRLTEMLYNGNLVAHEVEGTLLVIIPVDIAL